MSIDDWMDKGNVVYTFNEILFCLNMTRKFCHMLYHRWNLEDINMQCETSQSQEKYYMITLK